MLSRNMGLSKGFIWLVDASCDVIRGEEAATILYLTSSTGNPNHHSYPDSNLNDSLNLNDNPNFNAELLIHGFI